VEYRVVHGYRRAFLRRGRGPALLLIHGIGDSSDTWLPVIDDLARDYTVIAPDLLGHGRSAKPRADYSPAAYANAMRDLLALLDIGRATVVGHSLGGGVAMQFAYQYPERCERLVLVATGGIGRQVHPILRVASSPIADLVLPLLRLATVRSAGRVIVRALELLRLPLGRDAGDFQRMFDALPDTVSQRAFVRTLRAVVDWRGQHITMLDRCYLACHIPTLLVWGTHDAVLPYAHALAAHAAMPGSRLETFFGSGHFPHHYDRERFVRVLRDFLATTAPAQHRVAEWRRLLRTGRPAADASVPARQPLRRP
jgi:pimeloyl-ACP methyl ester carboxylesterase